MHKREQMETPVYFIFVHGPKLHFEQCSTETELQGLVVGTNREIYNVEILTAIVIPRCPRWPFLGWYLLAELCSSR